MDIELKERLQNMLPEEAGIDVGLVDEAVTQKSTETINQLMAAPNMIDEQIRELLLKKPKLAQPQVVEQENVASMIGDQMGRQISDQERMMIMQRMQELQGQPVMMQEGGDPMMEMMGDNIPLDAEEQQTLQQLIQQGEESQMAPLFEQAQMLATEGTGDDICRAPAPETR